jgi:hypothetical protein
MVADFEGVKNALLVKPADVAGDPTIALDGVSDVGFPDVARNGGVVTFIRGRSGDIEVRSLTNPDSARVIDRDDRLRDPALSHEGNYVAFEARSQGRTRVIVQQSWGDQSWSVSTLDQERAWQPRWSPDGRWLFYRTADRLWRTRVQLEPTFRLERPEMLFELPDGAGDYVLHPDGDRVLIWRRVNRDQEGSTEKTRLSLRVNLGKLLNEIAPPSR